MFDITLDVAAPRKILIKNIVESDSLRIETSGEVLWTRKLIKGFH